MTAPGEEDVDQEAMMAEREEAAGDEDGGGEGKGKGKGEGDGGQDDLAAEWEASLAAR